MSIVLLANPETGALKFNRPFREAKGETTHGAGRELPFAFLLRQGRGLQSPLFSKRSAQVIIQTRYENGRNPRTM